MTFHERWDLTNHQSDSSLLDIIYAFNLQDKDIKRHKIKMKKQINLYMYAQNVTFCIYDATVSSKSVP